jgi:hypothetical protein
MLLSFADFEFFASSAAPRAHQCGKASNAGLARPVRRIVLRSRLRAHSSSSSISRAGSSPTSASMRPCSLQRSRVARGKRLARAERQAGGSGYVCRPRCRLGAGDNKAVEGCAGHLDDERGAPAVDGGEVVDTRPPAGAERDDPGQAGTRRAMPRSSDQGVSLTRTTRTEASGTLMFPRSAPSPGRSVAPRGGFRPR